MKHYRYLWIVAATTLFALLLVSIQQSRHEQNVIFFVPQSEKSSIKSSAITSKTDVELLYNRTHHKNDPLKKNSHSNSDEKHSVPLKMSNWEVLQERRKKVLKENCKKLPSSKIVSSKNQRGRLANILVDDNHKALYCYIPKVACTQWKRLMLVLSTNMSAENVEQMPSINVHFSHKLKSLMADKLKKDEILRKLNTYRKFLFVRHPMERLLSAFNDKFASNTSEAKLFKRTYAFDMMKFARNTKNVSKSGEGMKFQEFLSFVSSNEPISYQEHWAPYLNLCLPCSIDYDFIGMYETLEQDANEILERINAPSSLKFPKFVPSNTKENLKQLSKKIPNTLYDKIYDKYKADFLLFNYEK